MFNPVESDGLPEKIADRILELIRAKHLNSGDKLPSERELATMMGISRPSIRQALRVLDYINVIEVRPGSGAYVSSLTPDELTKPLDFIFELDDSNYFQLFEARRALEVTVSELAAQKISGEALTELESLLAQAEGTLENTAAYLEIDLRIHQIVAEAADNPILHRFMESITGLSLSNRKRSSAYITQEEQQLEMKDHQALVEALRTHDSQAAGQAMLNHMKHVEAKLVRLSEAGVLTPNFQINRLDSR